MSNQVTVINTGTAGVFAIVGTYNGTIEVTIELRPPRKGEIGWYVGGDATPEAMLASVIAGRCHHLDTGALGFGWNAWRDMPKVDSDGDRVITVRAREVTL